MNAHTVGIRSAPAPTAPNVAVGVAAHAIGEARREVSELLATGDAGACAIDVEYRDIGGIGAIGRACIDGSHHSHTHALGGSVAPEDPGSTGSDEKFGSAILLIQERPYELSVSALPILLTDHEPRKLL